MSEKNNKTVTLITGTRKGVGKYLVEHFVKQGHLVVGCSRESPNWKLANYTHFIADVSDEKQVRPIFSHINSKLGRLDNLINNAGITSMNHSLLTPIATVRKVIDTNIIGTFLFCQEAGRLMQRHGKGRIVNFSTVAVPIKLAGEAMYTASKSAVEMLTRILAKEYSDFGVTVNALGPSLIQTELISAISEDKLQALLANLTLKRFSTFEDFSNLIDFFLKEESNSITGQVVYLGGI